jgi:hypothetical protein
LESVKIGKQRQPIGLKRHARVRAERGSKEGKTIDFKIPEYPIKQSLL